MKDFLLSLALGLVVTCAINSLLIWLNDVPGNKSLAPAGIAETAEGRLGPDKRDFMIPEIDMVDAAQSPKYATKVVSPGGGCCTFPMGSAF